MNTRDASKGHIFAHDIDTVTYGRKSIKYQAILSCNYLTDIYPEENFITMPRHRFSKLIKQHFVNLYASIQYQS